MAKIQKFKACLQKLDNSLDGTHHFEKEIKAHIKDFQVLLDQFDADEDEKARIEKNDNRISLFSLGMLFIILNDADKAKVRVENKKFEPLIQFCHSLNPTDEFELPAFMVPFVVNLSPSMAQRFLKIKVPGSDNELENSSKHPQRR